MAGFIYVMSNPAFPKLVKIGKSAKDPALYRVNELNQTGVPAPFKVEYSALVDDEDYIERVLHHKYREKRYASNREFFELEVNQTCREVTLLLEENKKLVKVLKAPRVEVPTAKIAKIAKKEPIVDSVESFRNSVTEKYFKDKNEEEKKLKFRIEYEQANRNRKPTIEERRMSYRFGNGRMPWRDALMPIWIIAAIFLLGYILDL